MSRTVNVTAIRRMTMDKNEAIKILRKGYPDINKYAASELEAYEYDVDTYNEAVGYAISRLEADKEADIYEEHSCLTCKYGNLYSDSEPCCNCTDDNDMFEPIESEVENGNSN